VSLQSLHTPVLLQEILELLKVQPGGRYIDCTVGTGGHAEAILKAGGVLLGIDVDPQAIEVTRERLQSYESVALSVNRNFKHLEAICDEYSFYPVDGILFDLGMSSPQLQDRSRGFSFQLDAPLDMRFDPTQPLTTADIVNDFSESEIASLLREYAEEAKSHHIAKEIVHCRPIISTFQLVKVVEQAKGKSKARIHPATKTFQALRIAVNQELECLSIALRQAVNLLGIGGRLAVISYHSLEDRLVKEFLQQETKGCLCPPDVPICVCNHVPTLKLVNRKVIKPSQLEIEANPRSRSARLRVAERCPHRSP
jgi:16S rRNA (cytosine1402-N4)-methyltransferase